MKPTRITRAVLLKANDHLRGQLKDLELRLEQCIEAYEKLEKKNVGDVQALVECKRRNKVLTNQVDILINNLDNR